MTIMNVKILVMGSLNVDLVVTASHLPQKGETIIGGLFQTHPGGKGANQAVAAARMGGKISMVGSVGKDAYGDQLCRNLKAEGIDICFVNQIEEMSTGVAVITVDSEGQNTIVVASGANFTFSPENIISARDAFTGASVFVTQLEIPVPTVLEGLRLAKQNGVVTILNPAPAQNLPDEVFGLVDYLIPNELELSMLTGETNQKAAIQQLLDKGVQTVIVTLGSNGAVIATRDSIQMIPAFQVDAVDTVAAGDAFIGAFAIGISEALSVRQAAILASAAAALSVTRHGAQPSLPWRSEVEDFLKKH